MNTSNLKPREISVFFYGGFIRPDIMRSGGLVPERTEVARLNGFDISISPHACITRSAQHCIYGILVKASHTQLDTLYSKDGVGIFLPEAVIVETQDGGIRPAMCYIPPAPDNKPVDLDYLDRLLDAARTHQFPLWYVQRLEQFRMQ